MSITDTHDMPTAPVRNGIAAIDVDGDRYCIDCAADVLDSTSMGFRYDDGSGGHTDNLTGQQVVEKLIAGDIYTLDMGGVLSVGAESPHMHCGAHADCHHALSGDDHPYDHDQKVGGRLDLTEIPH